MKLADGTGTSGNINKSTFAKNSGGEPEIKHVDKPSIYGNNGSAYNSNYNSYSGYKDSYENGYTSYSSSGCNYYTMKAKPNTSKSIFGCWSNNNGNVFGKKGLLKVDSSKSKSKSKKKSWSKSNSKSKKSRSKSKSK